MKSVGKVVSATDFFAKRNAQESRKKLDEKSADVVNRLFMFFQAICRGFEKQYAGDLKKLNMEKIQWARGFMDYGIENIEQLEFGIKRCRLESPINTPSLGQFLKWCTPAPEELGIPRLEYAYAEACANSHPLSEKKWTHKAVYHAWSMCNAYELANLPKKNTFPIFERNYDIIVKMIVRGEQLGEIPIAVTHDKEYKVQDEIGKEFEHCNNYEAAKAAMERVLGKKIDGSAYQKRMQKNSKQNWV